MISDFPDMFSSSSPMLADPRREKIYLMSIVMKDYWTTGRISADFPWPREIMDGLNRLFVGDRWLLK